MKMRTEKEIKKELKRLKEQGSPRFGCSMGYEYATAVEQLEWVLGLKKYPSLGGRRSF